MAICTKPRSSSLKVPWPLTGCGDAGLGRRFSPSALRMRQMLSRLRCGRKCIMTNVRLSRAKLVTRRSVQTMARSASAAFQGNWCGRAEWSRQSAAPRLRHLRMVSADTPERWADAAALMGAGDLGTGDGRGAGVRMDLQHRSDLPLSGLDQTVEQVAVGGNSMPHWVPTMFHDLTAHHHRGAIRWPRGVKAFSTHL